MIFTNDSQYMTPSPCRRKSSCDRTSSPGLPIPFGEHLQLDLHSSVSGNAFWIPRDEALYIHKNLLVDWKIFVRDTIIRIITTYTYLLARTNLSALPSVCPSLANTKVFFFSSLFDSVSANCNWEIRSMISI